MVNAALSRFSTLGEDGQALVAHLGKAAGDRDPFRLRAGGTIDGEHAILERGHIGRVAGDDAGFPVGAGDDDHVVVIGIYQPVGCDELEMQVGHYSLPSIAASNALVAASNLSRHPVLQKPTTLPR